MFVYLSSLAFFTFLIAFYLKYTLQYSATQKIQPYVNGCTIFYLCIYITTILAIGIYVATFVAMIYVSPQQPLHFCWHSQLLSIKCSLQIAPQSTYSQLFSYIYIASQLHMQLLYIIHDIKVFALMYSAVICTTKFKSLTTGHFLSFYSCNVAKQQISCTSSNKYNTIMRTNDYHQLANYLQGVYIRISSVVLREEILTIFGRQDHAAQVHALKSIAIRTYVVQCFTLHAIISINDYHSHVNIL